MTKVIIGIVLPFLGTTLGSATVFFLKKEMNSKLQNLLRGFAAGVMIAASVWSLLIPSIDMAEAAGKKLRHGCPPLSVFLSASDSCCCWTA